MKQLFALLAVVFTTVQMQAQNPVIQTIINEVNLDSMIYWCEDITGERPIVVNGVTDSIISRHKDNPGNDLTVDYLEQKLTSWGFTPTRQSFSVTGENLILEHTGSVYPDQKYVICAHFDAMPGAGPAPAADDDGSGTVALLEAVRILTQYEFEYTIVFGWWDEEEQGLVGAEHYAASANANNEDILGVFNMDAIAWDGDGDDLARVHTRPIANSLALADTVQAINTDYNIGLNLVTNNPGATYSDHAAFWNENISAVLIIEDFDNDGNPHYHTPTDLVQYFDTAYFKQLAQLSFGAVASCAVPYDPLSGIEEEVDFKIEVWPNPVGYQIYMQADQNFPIDEVAIYDQTGRLVLQPYFTRQKRTGIIVCQLPSSFAPGTYILEAVGPKGKYAQQIIKE